MGLRDCVTNIWTILTDEHAKIFPGQVSMSVITFTNIFVYKTSSLSSVSPVLHRISLYLN